MKSLVKVMPQNYYEISVALAFGAKESAFIINISELMICNKFSFHLM